MPVLCHNLAMQHVIWFRVKLIWMWDWKKKIPMYPWVGTLWAEEQKTSYVTSILHLQHKKTKLLNTNFEEYVIISYVFRLITTRCSKHRTQYGSNSWYSGRSIGGCPPACSSDHHHGRCLEEAVRWVCCGSLAVLGNFEVNKIRKFGERFGSKVLQKW